LEHLLNSPHRPRPPLFLVCHRTISSHPDPAHLDAKVKETMSPPPEEEPEQEVHHTDPATSLKSGGEGSPLQHHLDAASHLYLSWVRTRFISTSFWTDPHPQLRPLPQARHDSSELVPWRHGTTGHLSRAAVTSSASDPGHPSQSQRSRLDQSHTSSLHKILALHLGFNGSE
jgi:hypothetical protein